MKVRLLKGSLLKPVCARVGHTYRNAGRFYHASEDKHFDVQRCSRCGHEKVVPARRGVNHAYRKADHG